MASKKSKKRWTRREYLEHRMDLIRGKDSRHKDNNGPAKSRGLFNLTFDQDSMAEMYEENAVRGSEGVPLARNADGETYTEALASGATERENYRNDQDTALKKQFRANIMQHPAFEGMPPSEVANIADRYLKGEDFIESPEFRAALKEVSDFTTGDGETYMSDKRTWRENYPKTTDKENSAKESSGTTANGTSNETTVANGSQIGSNETPTGTREKPLTPRSSSAPSRVPNPTTATSERNSGTTNTGIVVNGLSNNNQTVITDELNEAAQNYAGVLAANARTAKKDAAAAEAAADLAREKGKIRNQIESDEESQRYYAEKAKQREAKRAERMDSRYKSRTLRGKSDWENLGRNAVRRNFDAKGEDESNEDYNKRKGAVDRVEALRRRFTEMMDKNPEDTNAFYANNPNRMKDVRGLSKLFEDAAKSGMLTDAQMDGIENTLTSYQVEADNRRSVIDANIAMNKAENVNRYRKMYGLSDPAFSDKDVLDFHEARQKEAQKQLLRDMDIFANNTLENDGTKTTDAKAIKKFGDQWTALMQSGFDVNKTYREAMEDSTTKAAYKKAVAGIAIDDPDRADKLDQLKRRFVLNQAKKSMGLGDEYTDIPSTLGNPDEKGIDSDEKKLREQAEQAARENNAKNRATIFSEGLPGAAGLIPKKPKDRAEALDMVLRDQENLKNYERRRKEIEQQTPNASVRKVKLADLANNYAANNYAAEASLDADLERLKPKPEEDSSATATPEEQPKKAAMKGGDVLRPRRRVR